jgi:hypothetical protein
MTNNDVLFYFYFAAVLLDAVARECIFAPMVVLVWIYYVLTRNGK